MPFSISKYFMPFLFFLFSFPAYGEPYVSPSLLFSRTLSGTLSAKRTASFSGLTDVTLRFSSSPDMSIIRKLASFGVRFPMGSRGILHAGLVYPASIPLESLELLSSISTIERIEDSYRPSASSTLNVSNPDVQAVNVWNIRSEPFPYDGSGVVIANIDTGIDIFHPGFFHADGGEFSWIDVNNNSIFDSGIDCVDLNANGKVDAGEILRFYDASCPDVLGLIERTNGIYDVDLDWLYNDANGNGIRDYGPDAGFSESSPSFGERIFIVADSNASNRLDPGETLVGLGTSKILAIIDKNGIHQRGQNLFTNTGDTTNHGTASTGVLCGQIPGRRLTGMAPGAEIIMVNRLETGIEKAILQARELGASLFMYEYGSWVYEFLDGSSNIETMIATLSKEGYPQFTASGNLAGPTRKKHAFFTIPTNGKTTCDFSVPEIGVKEIYASIIWRGKTPQPTLTLTLTNGSTAPLSGDSIKRTYGDISILSGYDYSTRGTSRMDILITSSASISGTFTINARNASTKTTIDINAYIADNVTQWNNGVQFQNFVTDNGTICMPGTALNDITVGAYDPRGTRNLMGDINDFSSRGKTTDGRRAVDITAPGTLVYSLGSHYSNGGNPGGYFEFGGTSSALPHVAGCSALILQAHPMLAPDSLLNILSSSAATDVFTGDVPNNIWGYGKLRVLSSFRYMNLVPVTVSDMKPTLFTVSNGYPNPFNGEITFSLSFPGKSRTPIYIDVYSILGQKVYSSVIPLTQLKSNSIPFSFSSKKGISSGIYFFRFRHAGNMIVRKATFLK